MEKSVSQAQTVTHALDILNLFTIERSEFSMTEMSRALGISKSSAHRLANTLEAAGYLDQDPTTQRYHLGLKILQLAGIVLENMHFRELLLPWMQWLRTQTKETISVYVADNDVRVCVDRLEGTQDIRFVVEINSRLPLYLGAAGKLLLAYQPAAIRNRLIEHWLADLEDSILLSLGSFEEIEQELAQIREQGYTISKGERVAHAFALAAPILDYRGEILAALTISGPSVRFTEEHIQQWLPLIQHAAGNVSAQLGYIASAATIDPSTKRSEPTKRRA
ncbi:MAG TPA: IclR family transcriptional regulator [Ktedonobacteraceae bacterium]|nr:IclR family transcriptional regulator [Ktedonobacteraceae bacterium]